MVSIHDQYNMTETLFPAKIEEECGKLVSKEATANCINTDLSIVSRLRFICLMRYLPLLTQILQLVSCWLNQCIVDWYLVSNPLAFLNCAVIGAFLAYNHAKFDSVKPLLPQDSNEMQKSVFDDQLTW